MEYKLSYTAPCHYFRGALTDPPLLSFRRASQTVMASLKSPSMVANSASRRCWLGGAGAEPLTALDNDVLPGRDDTEEVML